MAWKDVKTHTINQTVAIDKMLSHHGLAESNSVRMPVGDDTNDDDSPVYLAAKRGKKGEPTIRDF